MSHARGSTTTVRSNLRLQFAVVVIRPTHVSAAYCIVLGKILASCSVDGGICLDVASSGELLSRFFAPTTPMSERVRVHAITFFAIRAVLHARSLIVPVVIMLLQRINSVYFSSGSRFLASGGHDGCVRVRLAVFMTL